ncbi:hypothetical protein ACT2E5_30770 [Burkholderia vietnamiensis]|uniref:hypothetical protein n=1 Tax=Burkholderia vietnamiensis TaxID=60552 RepID=UPI00402A9036
MKTLSLYFRLSRRARDNSLCDDIAHPLVHLMNGAVRGGSMAGPNDSLAAHSVLNKGRLPLSGGKVGRSTRIELPRMCSRWCSGSGRASR